MNLINLISTAAAGFSILALILLFFQKRIETRVAKYYARILLCVLIAIQFIQLLYINDYLSLNNRASFLYLLLQALVGPVFYLYSQHIIQTDRQWLFQENLHFLPALVLFLFSLRFPASFSFIYSLIFLLGGFYMLRLAWSLYLLRERRTLFKMEFLFTAGFLGWSLAVVITGVLGAQLTSFLLSVQIIMLSLLIAAALHIQLNYPHLLSSLEEIANRQYQTSTLLNVNCETLKKQLEELMSVNNIYQDSELSLSSCADSLSLKPYQLSELINTQLNMSFSTYLRQKRVQAAQILLKNEPKISVLAIGLSVGFSSQSAFYSAFKEIHAMAPGQYRRKQ